MAEVGFHSFGVIFRLREIPGALGEDPCHLRGREGPCARCGARGGCLCDRAGLRWPRGVKAAHVLRNEDVLHVLLKSGQYTSDPMLLC